VALLQISLAVSPAKPSLHAIYAEFRLGSVPSHSPVPSAPPENTGACVSVIVKMKEAVSVNPQSSVAITSIVISTVQSLMVVQMPSLKLNVELPQTSLVLALANRSLHAI